MKARIAELLGTSARAQRSAALGVLLFILACGSGSSDPSVDASKRIEAPLPAIAGSARSPTLVFPPPAGARFEGRDVSADVVEETESERGFERIAEASDWVLAETLRRSRDSQMSEAILQELASRGSGETLEAAIHLLEDPDPQARALAADELAALGNPRAIGSLYRALDLESQPEVRAALTRALVRLDPEFHADGQRAALVRELEALERAVEATGEFNALLPRLLERALLSSDPDESGL